ncbi:MAG: glutathione S-transferase family protein [Lysobacterales bacterium]
MTTSQSTGNTRIGAPLRLVIGNKRYSSWSLRPWLLLRHFQVPFEETRLALDTPGFADAIGVLSPSRRVPALHHGDLVLWDSLAICEYASEEFLGGRGWPSEIAARAQARAAACEMHAGFAALRAQLPMHVARVLEGHQRLPDAQADIDRVQALWRHLRAEHGGGGDFLCGDFGIVDAMFAPVAIRFRGYSVDCDKTSADYVDALYAVPALKEWIAAGIAESERLEKYEAM